MPSQNKVRMTLRRRRSRRRALEFPGQHPRQLMNVMNMAIRMFTGGGGIPAKVRYQRLVAKKPRRLG